MENKGKAIRVLELYNGIGGMRYALELSGIPHEVVAAVDVNPVVNSVYCHNFGKANHLQRNIQSFTAAEIDSMNLDLITMSPPCQPFTRVGLKKDVDDARSCSFLHLLKVISDLQKKPAFFLLENVKGFEESLAHGVLLDTLKKCSYTFQEFLLSPSDLGIPNSRLRYYIIARLESNFSFPVSNKILTEVPDTAELWQTICNKCLKEGTEKCCIRHFLEDKADDEFERYLVPEAILLKYAKVFDIVYPVSSQSCCFTKAYGRYSLGTGSILTSCDDSKVSAVFQEVLSATDKNKELQQLKTLRLRYFTPREVANLMCFPSTFSVPPTVNDKQMYKALGNSVNVFVVSFVMKLLIQDTK